MTEKTRRNALEPMRSIGQSEDELMNLLVQVPLASIGNLASMYGGDRNRYRRELQKMEDNGLVVHSMEGYSQRRQNRYCAVDLAPASPTGALRPLFPALVGDLRIRSSLVESVYQIVAQAVAAEPQRKLEAFQWRFDEVLDAGAVQRWLDGLQMVRDLAKTWRAEQAGEVVVSGLAHQRALRSAPIPGDNLSRGARLLAGRDGTPRHRPNSNA